MSVSTTTNATTLRDSVLELDVEHLAARAHSRVWRVNFRARYVDAGAEQGDCSPRSQWSSRGLHPAASRMSPNAP